MGSEIKNLKRKEANQKIKELAETADLCFFTTNLSELPLSARPMSTQEVDDEGNLWFFSDKDSDKNDHIKEDNRVQLFYCNKGSSEYLSLFGTATIIQDAKKAKELWSAPVKIWFDSPDDPNLTIIKVEPQDGYYWDTKNGKFVALLKMTAGMITGKEFDDSVEGRIKA